MFCIIFYCIVFILGSGTIAKSHAVDPQSKNTSKDDLQQTSVKLPEMPIPVLHRSGKFLYNYLTVNKLI